MLCDGRLSYCDDGDINMSFSAKVKKTGCLFEAIRDAASTRSVDALEETTSYWGFLYPGQFDSAKDANGFIIFRCTEDRKQATLPAEDLEQIQLPLKIELKQKIGERP